MFYSFIFVEIYLIYNIMLVSYVWSERHSVVSDSLQSHGLYNPWNSLGQNTGVGSLSLLQGIFPTQGSNPGLPHCRWILYSTAVQIHTHTHTHPYVCIYRVSLLAQTVKNLPAMQETMVQFLGQEDALEKVMATHSIILSWRNLWTDLGRLQSMGYTHINIFLFRFFSLID